MSMNLDSARINMVENQVRPWEVLDARVLDALGSIRREQFVPDSYRNLAYADTALPIGHGEVMLKPVIEGRLLQALAIEPGERVLEIGTGSGYLTACIAQLAGEVLSIEQHADLADAARARLDRAGIRNVRIDTAEAIHALDLHEQFDAVAIGGAVHALPERFRRWVAPGGRLFAVVGDSPAMQAQLHSRTDDTHWTVTSLFETDIPYLAHAAPPRLFTL
ncbi:MAG: protein-L-isoaspartate O-methyltransferase [Dokdonella sp.]